MSLKLFGWGPGGRRFKSCLPDVCEVSGHVADVSRDMRGWRFVGNEAVQTGKVRHASAAMWFGPQNRTLFVDVRSGLPDCRSRLPGRTRIMVKEDGSILIHADSGGYKPLNCSSTPERRCWWR